MRILYVGHVGHKSGYGRAATDNVRALIRAGADVQIARMNTIDLPPDLAPRAASSRGYDAMIVHTLPMDCPQAAHIAMTDFGAPQKLVAYTTWETLTAPAHVALPLGEALFSEVWTPSRASMHAFTHHDDAYEYDSHLENVHVIPHCFDPQNEHVATSMHDGSDRARGGRVRFYWIGEWTARKNPMGVIRAFCHAFNKEDDVELVMHSKGADLVTCYAALAQTGLQQNQIPPITITNSELTDEQLWTFHRSGDVFVSASRGEAWNLPCFEALLAGKLIIAPDELGSDDFLGSNRDELVMTNAMKIPVHTDIAHVSVKAVQQGPLGSGQIGFQTQGAQGLTSKRLWNEPDLVAMSMEMYAAGRCVRDAGECGQAYYSLTDHFGYDSVAKLMLERLSQ